MHNQKKIYLIFLQKERCTPIEAACYLLGKDPDQIIKYGRKSTTLDDKTAQNLFEIIKTWCRLWNQFSTNPLWYVNKALETEISLSKKLLSIVMKKYYNYHEKDQWLFIKNYQYIVIKLNIASPTPNHENTEQILYVKNATDMKDTSKPPTECEKRDSRLLERAAEIQSTTPKMKLCEIHAQLYEEEKIKSKIEMPSLQRNITKKKIDNYLKPKR